MSEDCACLYGDEGDSPDFYQERRSKARTEHRCYECKRGIWPGDSLMRVSGRLFAEGPINSACLDKLATVEGKRYLAERWWQWVKDEADQAWRRRRFDSVRALACAGGGLL